MRLTKWTTINGRSQEMQTLGLITYQSTMAFWINAPFQLSKPGVGGEGVGALISKYHHNQIVSQGESCIVLYQYYNIHNVKAKSFLFHFQTVVRFTWVLRRSNRASLSLTQLYTFTHFITMTSRGGKLTDRSAERRETIAMPPKQNQRWAENLLREYQSRRPVTLPGFHSVKRDISHADVVLCQSERKWITAEGFMLSDLKASCYAYCLFSFISHLCNA